MYYSRSLFILSGVLKKVYLPFHFISTIEHHEVEAKANYLNLFQSEKKTFRAIIQPYRKLYWDVTGFLASIVARGKHKEAWSLFRLIVEYLKKLVANILAWEGLLRNSVRRGKQVDTSNNSWIAWYFVNILFLQTFFQVQFWFNFRKWPTNRERDNIANIL